MSLVDFTGTAVQMPFELDGLLEPLSRVERQNVRNTLALVARGLSSRSGDIRAVRVRLDGVIAALTSVVDAIDGETYLEPGCEDEGARCDDEGKLDENGLSDAAGAARQDRDRVFGRRLRPHRARPETEDVSDSEIPVLA